MSTSNKIKVLIVDDSALVRKVLREWINAQEDMMVLGTAANPYVAVEKMKIQKPDVITLDIEMPRMDGLTFLRKLMSQHPVPVIIVSSLSQKGSEVAIRALEYGAIDIFLKDDIRVISQETQRYELLIDRIRAAGQARIKRAVAPVSHDRKELKELSTVSTSEKIVVLGASTGGTTAIHDITSVLPLNTPGMVIVQHMPKSFTKLFANRLNELSALSIKEAEDGDRVLSGKVLIAPGDRHLKIVRQGATVIVETWDGPPVNRHRPSVDVLFESAADQLGKNAIGVLLTGMGKDGAAGLLAIRNKGAFTIAQDEESAVVYGMPKEAARLNAAAAILPLAQIPHEILKAS